MKQKNNKARKTIKSIPAIDTLLYCINSATICTMKMKTTKKQKYDTSQVCNAQSS